MKKELLLGLCLSLLGVCPAFGKVTGVCANCHTMHNSQDGGPLAAAGTNAGWSESGELAGGSAIAAQSSLLISDCVGCHSSSTASSIITVNGSRIPIVYNTSGPPTQPLAGGNFYWVNQNGEEHGHNVRGVSPADTKLTQAPGSTWLQAGCGPSCHISLTLPNYDNSGNYNNGCEGCHQSVRHHGDDPAGQPVSPDGGWYRFLSAPIGHMLAVGGGGVYGIEHPNWEQDATASSHNIYYGGSMPLAGPNYYESMSTFCAGCHTNFHAPGGNGFWTDNGGNGTPWLRHPTDVAIPNRDEYGAGKVINTVYTPAVPVGKDDLASFNGSIIEEGDRVICMSCHRAHGSPYPDMLRWDYNGMLAHDSNSAAGTGCFKCHTTKDEA